MKLKRFNKRLSLNKETIVNLGKEDMAVAKGGNLWESYADPGACAEHSDRCSLSCSILIINNICY